MLAESFDRANVSDARVREKIISLVCFVEIEKAESVPQVFLIITKERF